MQGGHHELLRDGRKGRSEVKQDQRARWMAQGSCHGGQLYFHDVLQYGALSQKPLLHWADPRIEDCFPTESSSVRYQSVVSVDDRKRPRTASMKNVSVDRIAGMRFFSQADETP